ncbi:MAG: ferritin-like domain-containing protein [Methylotenera sp.]|nr:ferritin-like domain-containing protein [Methylotenera sp.]
MIYEFVLLELRQAALVCLAKPEAIVKANAVRQLASDWQEGKVTLEVNKVIVEQMTIPGRPDKPQLIAPRLLKHRAMNTLDGRAALIHALAHIEFNAINLALDVIWRFNHMPAQFYTDWLKVADEEAYHFGLLNAHLQQLGFSYGDFDAHNSLWEMAEKTKNSVLARIALVPRTMEARGLDASPQLRAKLAQAGDMAAAEILDIILRDEIGHVAIGNHWFNWLCEQNGLESLSTFEQLCNEYAAPKLRPPFNLGARRQAGFSELELAYLTES